MKCVICFSLVSLFKKKVKKRHFVSAFLLLLLHLVIKEIVKILELVSFFRNGLSYLE